MTAIDETMTLGDLVNLHPVLARELLHRWLAEGVVESGPRGARVRDLVVRPAKRAGCRLVIDVH